MNLEELNITEQDIKSATKVIRELCGYIENGSDRKLIIDQDDATKSWCIKIQTSATSITGFTGNQFNLEETIAVALSEVIKLNY